MKDNVGLRAGVLDDQSILDKPPAIEVYVERQPPVSISHPSVPFPFLLVSTLARRLAAEYRETYVLTEATDCSG